MSGRDPRGDPGLPPAAARYLEIHRDRFLRELEDFLRIPSVSAERRHAPDVRRCAEWLRVHLEETVGVDRARVVEGGGGGRHPFVLAEHAVDPALPTLLVYGHYDVQPADPEHLWKTPPFQPSRRGGRLYARGAADDKGQIHMAAKALECRIRSGAGLSANVKLLVDGEEEVGSQGLEAFLREEGERLACDAVLLCDTAMLRPDLPCITTGLRGIVYAEVTVRGPGRDLHSGSWGGAVVNPANALCEIVAGLKDAEGRVTIPGFYDRVEEPSRQERRTMERLPFGGEALRREVGAPALGGERGFRTLERLWFRPTLDVSGLVSGVTGEGAKTVLPSEARAKVSMRLVPDQEPEEVARAFENHLRALAPEGIAVEVSHFPTGRPWAATDPDHPLYGAVARALETAFGTPAAFVRQGVTVPIIPLLQDRLGVPLALVGFALPGSNVHAPNEWLDLEVHRRGTRALAALFGTVGACL